MTGIDWAALLTPAMVIGFLGTLAGMLWPLAPGRRGMLWVQVAAGSCFTVHFALIGASTGAFMNLLGTLQAAAAVPLGSRPGFRFIYLATLPVIAIGVALTWQGVTSILAAIAMALVSLGRYQLDERRFRLVFLFALAAWFSHNWAVASVPAMISDVVGFATCLSQLLLRPVAKVQVPAA